MIIMAEESKPEEKPSEKKDGEAVKPVEAKPEAAGAPAEIDPAGIGKLVIPACRPMAWLAPMPPSCGMPDHLDQPDRP